MSNNENAENLGRLLKKQRLMVPLTLRELANLSKVSPSHLGRIERGERFPSASILHRIANPLGFEENDLFSLAGYLSLPSVSIKEWKSEYRSGQLDPCVANILGQESVETQRIVIGILAILKSIAKSMDGKWK